MLETVNRIEENIQDNDIKKAANSAYYLQKKMKKGLEGIQQFKQLLHSAVLELNWQLSTNQVGCLERE